MRTILLIAAVAVVCQAPAHAKDSTTLKLAQASQTDSTAAQPAPAAPAPQAAPAAAAPDTAEPTAKATSKATSKATKPAKKRVAKRRNWEADEAKARSIAAKYGVSW